MICYFPPIYEDEVFYSIIARYHSYMGNLSLKTTMLDIYDDINRLATIEFPSNIKALVRKLPENFGVNEEDIVLKNTAFPYYSPFLPKKRAMKIKRELISGSGKGIKAQIGFIAGSICSKKGIMYCYQCGLEETKRYGEAYFHRIHQLQGVYVCEKHKCYLQQYPKSSYSKLNFIRLDMEGLKPINCMENKNELEQLAKIATEVKYLLQNSLNKFNQDKIHDMYVALLKDKGYITTKNHIKQRKLYEDFKEYYSNELLEKFESNIRLYNQNNWLALITRKPKKTIHPVRHILFIMFLCGSVKKFFNKKYKVKVKKTFSSINPACEHYGKSVVENVKISADYKTRQLIGTFECDGKTVVKYAEKLGLRCLLDSDMKCDQDKHNDNECIVKNLKGRYQKDMLKEIRENPQLSRNKLREKLKKQYIYLYRHDKEWLYKSLPPKQKVIASNNRSNNWITKDNEILRKLKTEYEDMMTDNSRARITISLLGRKIGELANLQKNIDKLPNTKVYLKLICETVAKYQLNRVDKVCTKLFKSDEIIKEWKVLRLAGLRKNVDIEVRKRILFYVNSYK